MDVPISDLKKGKRGAIARAITMIENDPISARRMMKKIFTDSKKRAIVIGMTGPAGAGKSSLIDSIAIHLKKTKKKPAILAVDPTSSITGGAMLGDRARMAESTDTGTFMRSLASRGATGAIARSVRDCIRVLEYAGFDPIILESVGAGQTETAIADIANVTVVVFNPQTGDSIQAIKAGLTEIGDVYVVNKSDLAGAEQLYNAVQDYVVGSSESPVLKTSVKRRTGIVPLVKAIAHAASENMGDNEANIRKEVYDIILNIMSEKADLLRESDEYAKLIKKIQNRKIDPYSAASKMAKDLIK